MSKADEALAVYNSMPGSTRRDVIDSFVLHLGVSEGYASTLYANTKRTATSSPAKPKATTAATTPTTPKIKHFDRATCRRTRSRVQELLDELSEELGCGIELEGGSFNSEEYKLKIRFVVTDSGNIAETDWGTYCHLFDLKPEHFGTTFTSQGTTFTICGIKPRAKRYPVIAVNENGTRYKFPASKVLTSL